MAEMNREEWLEERKRGIGGSDIAGVVGLSKWATPLTVWLDKTGREIPQVEGEEQLRMRMGRELEPVLTKLYQERTGVATRRGEFIVQDKEHRVGTPDLVAEDRIVELKTADLFKLGEYGEPGSDDVPPYYLVQCQWYMMLTGKQLCDLAVLFGLHHFNIYTIHHNPDLAGILQDKATDFWQRYVVPDTEPPMDGSEQVKKWLQSRYPKARGELIAATPEDDAWSLAHAQAKLAYEEVKERKLALENQMRYRIGAGAGIQGSNWRVTWKNDKDRADVDYQAVCEELQKIVPADEYIAALEEHTHRGPGNRRFLHYRKDGK